MMYDIGLSLIANFKSFAVPLLIFGVIFYFIEKIRPASSGTASARSDFLIELELAALNGVIFIPAFTYIITILYIGSIHEFLPFQIFNDEIKALPLIAQMFLGAFIMDFSTYWRHRFTHAFMWNYHAIHHSAKELTWITGLRLHPAEVLLSLVLDMTTLHVLGFEGSGIFYAAVFMQIMNYFAHSDFNVKFERPLRYIFVSPHYHRWHHANEKIAYDKNFCSAFPILDIIFGTYYHPDDRLPAAYGLAIAQMQEYPRPLWAQLLYPIKKHFKKK